MGGCGDEVIRLFETYKKLGFADVDCILYENCRHETWSCYMISGYEDAQKYIGKTADKNRKIYNGMLKTYFYQFSGPKPPRNVDCILYENCRHELLNELNRHEIMNDILRYLNRVTEAAAEKRGGEGTGRKLRFP